MKKIKEIDDSALAITRRKYGKGYAYYSEDGEKITDKSILKRLKGLVIPPMWTDVLICKFEDGHIQAIGRDLKGRKQYIYHSMYEKLRQEEKFKKLLDFVSRLPKIRKQAYKDLEVKGWPKEKLVAMIVLLLDEYGIRIGNKQYRNRNESYGLTTLRRKHLTVADDELIFSFKGKRIKCKKYISMMKNWCHTLKERRICPDTKFLDIATRMAILRMWIAKMSMITSHR